MNLIKHVCQQHGYTYAQLAEVIGYSHNTIRNTANKEEISPVIEKAIILFCENLKLREELERFKSVARNVIDEFRGIKGKNPLALR